MNTRLQQFLAAENLTQAQFAESINVAAAGISHILAGRNKPGYDFLLNTMKRYPALDIEWLMTGKGKMYKGVASAEQPVTVQPAVPSPASQTKQNELPFDYGNSPVDISEIISDTLITQDSVPFPAFGGNTKVPTDMKSADNKAQHVIRQRKAAKIIIFFDDNTFQEF
ncbi:MAG: hypothetical protein NC115_09400 [Bacteroidales bacterium]|nr:hypothetical protein [Bacteroidales bacterium]